MTSRFAYARLACGVLAMACLFTPAPADAQPYTNKPTVIVDTGVLDSYGYQADSDYTQDIQSVPVPPPGKPQNLTPQGMDTPADNTGATQQNGKEKLVFQQFAPKKSDTPFEPTNRQLTKPVLSDLLQSPESLETATQGVPGKQSHDEIFNAAVANAAKPPPAPASKPSDITWKESAFDDIIKPATPPHKPAIDDTATAALEAETTRQEKIISPFRQPPAQMNAAPDSLSVNFKQNSVVLEPEDKISLDKLATRVQNAPDSRLQLRAYASENPDDSVSGARRLSLSRALTVRAYLMQQDISPTRIDVRALGSDVPEGPADRVDLVVIQ